MNPEYIVDKEYKEQDFTSRRLPQGDYENCRFVNCTFTNSDLSETNFIECEFTNCDLSSVNLTNTGLKQVVFNACKILGVHFENCSTFLLNMQFNDCLLNLSSFYKLDLKEISINNCEMHEADFTEADLSDSTIKNCDLSGATFEYTNLEKADLRESYNYSIDPGLNKVKKAKFSMPGVLGLLDKFEIEVE